MCTLVGLVVWRVTLWRVMVGGWCVVVCGCVWLCVVVRCCGWLCVVVFGCVMVRIVDDGYAWLSVVVRGPVLLRVVVCGSVATCGRAWLCMAV